MVLGNVLKEILGKFSTTNCVQCKFYLLINIMKHSVLFFAKICNPKWKAQVLNIVFQRLPGDM